MDVVMDAIGSAVAGHIGARLYRAESQMQWVLGALRAADRGTCREAGIQHAACPEVTDGQHGVIGRHGDAVREQATVHHPAQNSVAGILINRAGLIGYVWSGTGTPGIGEEQISFGVEIQVVGPTEQLITVGIDQRADLFRLRIVDQNAAVPRRQVEFALVPPRALRLTGLTQIRWWVAIEYRDQLRVRGEIRD